MGVQAAEISSHTLVCVRERLMALKKLTKRVGEQTLH